MNEYLYRKIFEYIQISEYSSHPGTMCTMFTLHWLSVSCFGSVNRYKPARVRMDVAPWCYKWLDWDWISPGEVEITNKNT